MKKGLYLLALFPFGWVVLNYYLAYLQLKKRITKNDRWDIVVKCEYPLGALYIAMLITFDVIQMHTMVKFLIFIIVSYFSNFIFFRYVGKKWDSYIL